jgi:hypothetical protein
MPIESPDIETFKQNLDVTIAAIQKHKADSHSAIKIQSMLNVTVYVIATRFLEGSIKHIVLNCCKMKGYNSTQLSTLENTLKGFNNPEFSNIRDLLNNELGFDIIQGLNNGDYTQSDITFLNQIVQNRHRNVHASSDSSEWYNQNKKDIDNFLQEYPGMINIIEYLSNLLFQPGNTAATIRRTLPNNSLNAMAGELQIETESDKSNFWSKLKRLWS